MTYPTPAIQEFLRRHVAFAHVNSREPRAFAGILDRTPLLWTPTFLLSDQAGRHIRRWVGYLPSEAFLAEIRLGLAMHRLHRRSPGEALELLAPLLESHEPATPEALYWAGIAEYRIAGDKRALLNRWDELMTRFPDSPWAMHADCLDPLRDPA